MKKVYSLKDLSEEVGLKSTGYSIHVKPGVTVGLYDDIFNVHYDDGRVEQYAPGKIIPVIKSLLDNPIHTRKITDSELFDFAQTINDKVDEEEYFEMDLGDDPVKTVNEWLTRHMIPVTVVSVDEDDEDIIYKVMDK